MILFALECLGDFRRTGARTLALLVESQSTDRYGWMPSFDDIIPESHASDAEESGAHCFSKISAKSLVVRLPRNWDLIYDLILRHLVDHLDR